MWVYVMLCYIMLADIGGRQVRVRPRIRAGPAAAGDSG